jgi:hypothetical protein
MILWCDKIAIRQVDRGEPQRQFCFLRVLDPRGRSRAKVWCRANTVEPYARLDNLDRSFESSDNKVSRASMMEPNDNDTAPSVFGVSCWRKID